MRRPQTSPPPAPPPAPPGATVVQAGSEQVSGAVQFLDQCGLGVYSPVFYSHGFTTIESLLSIRHEDLARMSVKPNDQKKLKRALETYRSTGQVLPPQDGPPAYPQQMSTGLGEAMATGALAGTSVATDLGGVGPQAYGQASMQQPYPKGGLWIDTNTNPEGGGYQWVDGPGGSAGYQVDPNAQQQPPQTQPQASPPTPMYQQQPPVGQPPLYQGAGAQWVDSPTTSAPPVVQDMVFQWVDSPSHGRLHQQHYLPAPQVSPYYPGLDAHDPLRSPTQALHGHGLGLDLHSPYAQAGVPPYSATDASTRYQDYDHRMDLGGYQQPPLSNPPSPQVGGHYGQRRDLQSQYPGARSHMDDLGSRAHRDQYGQAGSYQLFDHGGRQGRGGGRGQDSRLGQGRGARHDDGSRGRGRGRQDSSGNDMSAPGRQGASQAGTQDYTGSGGFENMGPEALRSTLVSALESLYEDRIKPLANYVKGRLKERSCPESLVKNFVELYAEHSDLFRVERPTQVDDEVTIFCVKEPSWFKGWVDIDSPSDPYDEAMWQALEKFLDGEHTFAGGRYGMARELMQRHLSFLAPHSLGEVCHIVQLAIQHRRLIVYHRKMLKPIQTVLQPSATGAIGNPAIQEGEDIKDMDDLCSVLFRMLLHHPQGLRLCRLKQMIKHEFSRKLSEMSFQCTKLIELFNTEPLTSTFVLDTENDGKSIYVRMGNPENFSAHIKQIYDMVYSSEMARG